MLKLEFREGRGIGRPGSVFISVCGDGRYEGTLDNAVTSSRPPGVIDINVPCGDGVSTSLCWILFPFEVDAILNKRPSIVRDVGDITDSSPFWFGDVGGAELLLLLLLLFSLCFLLRLKGGERKLSGSPFGTVTAGPKRIGTTVC